MYSTYLSQQQWYFKIIITRNRVKQRKYNIVERIESTLNAHESTIRKGFSTEKPGKDPCVRRIK